MKRRTTKADLAAAGVASRARSAARANDHRYTVRDTGARVVAGLESVEHDNALLGALVPTTKAQRADLNVGDVLRVRDRLGIDYFIERVA